MLCACLVFLMETKPVTPCPSSFKPLHTTFSSLTTSSLCNPVPPATAHRWPTTGLRQSSRTPRVVLPSPRLPSTAATPASLVSCERVFGVPGVLRSADVRSAERCLRLNTSGYFCASTKIHIKAFSILLNFIRDNPIPT
jgi:hypothetical protein